MKTAILLAALFAAAAVNAETIATLPNEIGGTIRLTDTNCGGNRGLRIITEHPNGSDFIQGCYTYSDGNIYATYDTAQPNNRRIYKFADLIFTPYGRRILGLNQ